MGLARPRENRRTHSVWTYMNSSSLGSMWPLNHLGTQKCPILRPTLRMEARILNRQTLQTLVWFALAPSLSFPGGASGKEPSCQCRRHKDWGLIPGLERSPGGGHGNPLQYSCLENPSGQRSLLGYSPWGHKESDTTEKLTRTTHTHTPLSKTIALQLNSLSILFSLSGKRIFLYHLVNPKSAQLSAPQGSVLWSRRQGCISVI